MSKFDTDKDGKTMHSSQNLILFKQILYELLLCHIERTKSMSIARTNSFISKHKWDVSENKSDL